MICYQEGHFLNMFQLVQNLIKGNLCRDSLSFGILNYEKLRPFLSFTGEKYVISVESFILYVYSNFLTNTIIKIQEPDQVLPKLVEKAVAKVMYRESARHQQKLTSQKNRHSFWNVKKTVPQST